MSTRLRKVDRINPEFIDQAELLRVLNRFKNGDFATRLPGDRTGVAGKIYDTVNDIIDMTDRLYKELNRINEAVGKEGKLTHRATLAGATGSWLESIESINGLVADL